MKQLSNIIIAVLVLVILIKELGNCKGCIPTKDTIVKTDTLVIRDTIYIDKTVIHQVPVPVTVPQPIPPSYQPPKDCDSLRAAYLKLTESFVAKQVYLDSLVIPELSGRILVADTIAQNKLVFRKFDVKYSIPTKTQVITHTVQAPAKRQVYLGGFIVKDRSAFQSLNASLVLKTKSDKLYQIAAGINNQLKPQVSIGVHWKLFQY